LSLLNKTLLTTPKMYEANSSKPLVSSYQTRRRHVSEYSIFQISVSQASPTP
jgi:hypothetical protein